MSNKFTRKVIRSFMENCMKSQLRFRSTFSLLDLTSLYHDWDEIRSHSLNHDIDFINALMKYLWPNFCKKYISDGVRVIEFFLDPYDRILWDKVMKKIYDDPEANQLDEMNTKELKLCQFCGSEAELFEAPGVYFVECSNPKCCYPNNYDTKEEAIKAWNKRAFEPKTGKWTLYEDEETNAWECSVCHEVQQLMEGNPQENKHNFCPHCGARLEMEMKIMTEELKPCPYCGSEDIFVDDTNCEVDGNYEICFHCECMNCNARSFDYETEDDAIDAWNRQAEEKQS